MMNQNLIDFCNYIQPIVSGCSGFIRTAGYMSHIPGVIVMMSDDETVCSIIRIPIIFDIRIGCSINEFLSLKEDEQKSDLFNGVYFTGYNIKFNHMMNYLEMYTNIDLKTRCIYSEDDCRKIPGFEEMASNSEIGFVNVSDGIYNYRIPASKAITPLTKSDSASLRLYDYVYDPYMNNIKTIKYTVFKKKFKLSMENYSNILVI